MPRRFSVPAVGVEICQAGGVSTFYPPNHFDWVSPKYDGPELIVLSVFLLVARNPARRRLAIDDRDALASTPQAALIDEIATERLKIRA
jgi:hypothetical protein